MKLRNYFLLLTLIGCASSTPQSNRLVRDFNSKDLPSKIRVDDVPFILQYKDYCGPVTLAMAMQWAGKDISVDQISKHSFIATARGTFQMDMISAARREGLLVIPIQNIESLIYEIAAGNPVIVFENIGLSWYPQWHYAIVHGYDMKSSQVLMHSGSERDKWWSIEKFERSWKLANYWGLVILSPSKLSATASERQYVRAAASLEQIGKDDSAMKIYKSVLKKWPKSYMASMGIGNIYFKQENYSRAKEFFKQAIKFNPTLEMARHNLLITNKKLVNSRL